MRYRAVYSSPDGSGSIEQFFSIPRIAAPVSTRLTRIYPSSEELPENLLRIYLEFSAPMRQWGSYEHINLLHSSGKSVELPFLEVPEELWDRDGRRLTLLFDPGRIKRGLKPRREVGSALLAGEDYSLIINSNWQDARDAPLVSSYRKDFRVTAADRKQPDPSKWKLSSPDPGGREALLVEFDEALDHALLEAMLWIDDPEGKAVECKLSLGQDERSIAMVPASPWQLGQHQLCVDVDLEDLAGNSIRWVFDRDMDEAGQVKARLEEVLRLPFLVSAASR
ncbi:MAG: hypothetical protein ACYTG5_23575 [Planctomycetota bacterium]|jgi:hypothetical protein